MTRSFFGAVLLGLAAASQAQPLTVLTRSDLPDAAQFGSVITGGDLSYCPPGQGGQCITGLGLYVGAPGPVGGSGLGAVIVYYDDFYNFRSVRLLNPAPAPGDRFGAALAAEDDRIAVGAPGSRRVTMFDLSPILHDDGAVIPTVELADPTPTTGGAFGASLAAGANFTAVTEAGGAGEVHLYDAFCRSTVDPPAHVYSFIPGTSTDRDFGRTVSINRISNTWSVSLVLISATAQSGDGVLYVYRVTRNRPASSCPLLPLTVTLQARLEGPAGFGQSVALNRAGVLKILVGVSTAPTRVQSYQTAGGTWAMTGSVETPATTEHPVVMLLESSSGRVSAYVAGPTGTSAEVIHQYFLNGPNGPYRTVNYAPPPSTSGSFGTSLFSLYLESGTTTGGGGSVREVVAVGAPSQGSGAVYVYRYEPNGPLVVGTAEAPAVDLVTVGMPFPNPSPGPVLVPVGADRARSVRVTISDLVGREVASSVHEVPEGRSEVLLDLSGMPSGTYVARLGWESGAHSLVLTVVAR